MLVLAAALVPAYAGDSLYGFAADSGARVWRKQVDNPSVVEGMSQSFVDGGVATRDPNGHGTWLAGIIVNLLPVAVTVAGPTIGSNKLFSLILNGDVLGTI